MRYFKFAKLVRDKILPHMQSNGQDPRGVRKLNDEEFISELIKKLQEESAEMSASNADNINDELADVYEILDHIKRTLNVTDEELEILKKKKRDKNGGFEDRTYIEDVGVKDDSEWLKYYLENPEKYPEVE